MDDHDSDAHDSEDEYEVELSLAPIEYILPGVEVKPLIPDSTRTVNPFGVIQTIFVFSNHRTRWVKQSSPNFAS